jgi:Domain of unknown function (DUF4352)
MAQQTAPELEGGQSRPEEKKKNFFLRHKILTFILVVLAVAVAGSALGGADVEEPVATTSSDSDTGGGEAAQEPQEGTGSDDAAESAAGIGDPVRDGKFEFTVTGVERGLSSVGEDFLEEEAQGEFVIVRLSVSNIGDEAQMLDNGGQVLYDSEGRKHETSSALFSLEGADKAFLENINPGNSIEDVPLLFDVPQETKLDRIELHDSLFSGGVAVSLQQ